MEYTIWCDESILTGRHYSDFYGGVLVRSNDIDEVNSTLKTKAHSLGLHREIKWSKVTSQYLDSYFGLVETFFDFVSEDKIKVRIMFRQSALEPISLSSLQQERRYHLLYYQFIKHAFGLIYSNNQDDVFLRTYFDKLPDSSEKNELFKNHIYALQSLYGFKQANIKIRRSDIAEVNSKKHIELQCLDVVLGAMAFRLNDFHMIKPEGSRTRGKRTVAKEKLYKYISKRIREIYPNFNIGISTGKKGDRRNFWNHPYRHWNFVPKEFRIDESKFK